MRNGRTTEIGIVIVHMRYLFYQPTEPPVNEWIPLEFHGYCGYGEILSLFLLTFTVR
jgi:hypothetical protein